MGKSYEQLYILTETIPSRERSKTKTTLLRPHHNVEGYYCTNSYYTIDTIVNFNINNLNKNNNYEYEQQQNIAHCYYRR